MEIKLKSTVINFDNVTKIYYGKDSGCCCGCNGNYAEQGTACFTRYKNAMIKANLVSNMADAKSWVNFPIGNKAYTIYFD